MSKRSIIVLVSSLILLAGGIGFGVWFLRNRSVTPSSGNPANSNQQTASDTLPSASSEGRLEANPVVQNGGAVVSGSPSSSTTSVRVIENSSVPQLLIAQGDAPQNPVYLYQGRTMTKQEYEKAWNASSTNKGDLGSAKPTAPIQIDPASDKDHDGLSYTEEMSLGTDPNNADTDGDGLTDGQEVKAYKIDPKNFDTDSDGLTDGDEVKVYKTDPLKKDTDGDGFSDGMEVQSGYNPLGAGKLKK